MATALRAVLNIAELPATRIGIRSGVVVLDAFVPVVLPSPPSPPNPEIPPSRVETPVSPVVLDPADDVEFALVLDGIKNPGLMGYRPVVVALELDVTGLRNPWRVMGVVPMPPAFVAPPVAPPEDEVFDVEPELKFGVVLVVGVPKLVLPNPPVPPVPPVPPCC